MTACKDLGVLRTVDNSYNYNHVANIVQKAKRLVGTSLKPLVLAIRFFYSIYILLILNLCLTKVGSNLLLPTLRLTMLLKYGIRTCDATLLLLSPCKEVLLNK